VSDGTTLLFGLPGVRVERVERLADGTRVVHVVTDEETAAACPSCGVLSASRKDRVSTSPKDIPYGQDRIIVRWNKSRWRRREDYCKRSSFTEAIAQVPARARSTRRLRSSIGAAIGEAARSVTEVAIAHGVSWPTTHRAFVAHAERLGEPEPTRVLGIDETRRGKPFWEHCIETGRWVRVDPWDTGFVDLAGDQGLLGQREGRTGATVIAWLSERSAPFREGVEYVAIDPAAAYASAVRTPGLLPNATLVVDHYHLVKLANDALTKVRRRITWDLRERRGRKIDPEWANRRRLLRVRERLSQGSFAKMWDQIQAEDPSAQILTAWIVKEELRTLLATVRLGGAPHLTRHRLHRFLS
jgi:transposase